MADVGLILPRKKRPRRRSRQSYPAARALPGSGPVSSVSGLPVQEREARPRPDTTPRPAAAAPPHREVLGTQSAPRLCAPRATWPLRARGRHRVAPARTAGAHKLGTRAARPLRALASGRSPRGSLSRADPTGARPLRSLAGAADGAGKRLPGWLEDAEPLIVQ